jgi:hypothetical protein
LQERGAAVVAVDRARGAAEIEVHSAAAGPNGLQGCLGQKAWIASQKLDLNREARRSPAAVYQFGNVPLEHAHARNRLADA